MTQGVNGHVLAQSTARACCPADAVHRPWGDGLIGPGSGKEKVAWSDRLPILTQDGQQTGREPDEAILLPLGLTDAKDHPLTVDVGNAEPSDLRDSQSSGVGGHEDGPMFDMRDRPKEPCDFLEAQNDREFSGLLGANDIFDNPLLAHGDAVEELQSASSLVVVAPGDVPLLNEMK
jgi:hypothetical protein